MSKTHVNSITFAIVGCAFCGEIEDNRSYIYVNDSTTGEQMKAL